MFTPAPSFGDVFDLRVSLRHIEPAIWRAVRVPAELPLDLVHEIIQIAFGWKNQHLHSFRASGITFTVPSEDDQMFFVDERAAPLGAVAQVGGTLEYTYDFGDDWEHDVAVERMTREDLALIVCTGGARACPPEDCGGPLGYQEMLTALASPRSKRHAEMKAWAPRGFDPEKFDLKAVNKKLATLVKRLVREQK